MMQRCYNRNTSRFSDYGGRGISVCDEWHDFQNFYNDMGDRPEGKTLDRINNDLGYSKENCRWATDIEQARNKRERRMNNNNSTGVPGVYWKPSHNKYVARKTVGGKRIYIGFFDSIEDAKIAMSNYASSAA